MDTSCQPQSQPDRLRPIVPPLGEPLTADWVTIDSEFVVVYSGHQTHLSADCLFAPKAKLDDGIIWLLYVTGDVSRAQVLSFLTALDSGNHVNLPVSAVAIVLNYIEHIINIMLPVLFFANSLCIWCPCTHSV